MDKRLLPADLSAPLATRAGIEESVAARYINALFETIEEALTTDRYAKVRALGTFKIITVSERESVNISTGQRIQIGEHAKISFTPDTALKELVNRPFAHFQTVTIGEHVDIQEMEGITGPPPVEKPAVVSDEASVPTPSDEAAPTPDELTDETTQATDEPEVSAEAPEPSEAETPPTQRAEETAQEEEEAPCTAQTETPEPQPACPAEEATEAPAEEATEAHGSETEVREDAPTAEHADSATAALPTDAGESPEEEAAPQPAAQAVAEQAPIAQPSHSTAVAEGDTEMRRKLRGWKTLALVLATLLLMGLSYFAGYYRVLCPCEYGLPAVLIPNRTQNAPVQKAPEASTPRESEGEKAIKRTEATPAEPQPTPVAPTTQADTRGEAPSKAARNGAQRPEGEHVNHSVPVAAPAKVSTQSDGFRYRIVGTRQSYTVQAGETLRNIALTVYGSKGYAPYIVRYNRIKDPDNVAAGTVLLLPELEKK